jgi:hypothetical protein
MLTREDDIDVHALRRQGWTISAIARHLGRDRKTIRAYLAGREAGVRAPRSLLDRFEVFAPYCAQRLADDPHLWASTLFDELGDLGYGGSYPTMTRQLRVRGLRPCCEPCRPAKGRPIAVIDHPAGQEALCGLPHKASAPGSWVCGMHTSTWTRSSSTRRRATYRDTVTSDTTAPCSATRRCHTRRAVCRCLRCTSLSEISQASMTTAHWSIAGRGRARYALRGGGSADANACRTARRWTLWRSASSRIDKACVRRSLRIASKSSTRVPTDRPPRP